MKIVATIEARMTSTRLPGKVLMPALGKPMLYHLVSRLRAVPSLDSIVLATTTNITDDPLVEFANTEEIELFRGSEENVLARVIGAAESVKADIIVEITGDCPIIDPDIVEQTISIYRHNECDYASNSVIRSYPDGMDTQVFSLDVLKKVANLTSDPLDLEHVSRYIWQHPQIFKLIHLVAPPSMNWPELGLTLDEICDYELLVRIIEHLSTTDPLFGCRDVIQYIRNNPEVASINRHVVRKGDS